MSQKVIGTLAVGVASAVVPGPDEVVVGAALGAASRAASGGAVKRIFSARVLERMKSAGDNLHDFPQAIGEEVMAKGRRVVKKDNYVQYEMRGTVNGKSGTYEVGVVPSASGKTEVITHWFFNPDK